MSFLGGPDRKCNLAGWKDHHLCPTPPAPAADPEHALAPLSAWVPRGGVQAAGPSRSLAPPREQRGPASLSAGLPVAESKPGCLAAATTGDTGQGRSDLEAPSCEDWLPRQACGQPGENPQGRLRENRSN